MKCVVLVKGVPDFREGKVSFKEDNTLNRGATPTVLNPNDCSTQVNRASISPSYSAITWSITNGTIVAA